MGIFRLTRITWKLFGMLSFLVVFSYGCLISGYTFAIAEIEKQFCDVSKGRKMGYIEDSSLIEASGLVASR